MPPDAAIGALCLLVQMPVWAEQVLTGVCWILNIQTCLILPLDPEIWGLGTWHSAFYKVCVYMFDEWMSE